MTSFQLPPEPLVLLPQLVVGGGRLSQGFVFPGGARLVREDLHDSLLDALELALKVAAVLLKLENLKRVKES